MPTLDRQGLEEEFNMDTEAVEPEIVENEGPDPFELEWEEDIDDIKVLKDNIDRANNILDRVEEELSEGNFSARLVEVAGQLINSITQGTKTILDNTNYNKYLDIKKGLALLKKREVDIKAMKLDKPKSQNLIVASREDVLKALEGKTIKAIEEKTKNSQNEEKK